MASILSVSGCGHEAMPRLWHTSEQTGSKVLVHGGKTQDYSKSTKRRLSSVVEVFDAYTESWQQKKVTGKTPVPGVYGTASASAEDDLFTFGGSDGSRFFNALHRLKGGSQWIELCSQKESPESPMAKEGAGMVAFGDKLAVIGGYGIPHDPTATQPGSSFIEDTRPKAPDGGGWTNEFHVWNPTVRDDRVYGEWISPVISGEKPPPCDGFTLTSIDKWKAVLFGGGNREQGRMNHLYSIDLMTMCWTKHNKSEDETWPAERAHHAACCLNYGQQHPQLLVTGGVSKRGKVLGDAWILDVNSEKWRQVSGTLQPRWGHSATAFYLVDGVTEVTMFGGSADPWTEPAEEGSAVPWTKSAEKLSKLADTTLLRFRCSGQSEWKLLSVTRSSELGSDERISMKKMLQQAMERAQQAEARVEQERERVQRAEARVLQERERVQRAEERAQRAEKRAQKAEERIQQQDGRKRQRVQQAEARAPGQLLGISLDAMPRLHQLQVLRSSSGEELRIREGVCAQWEDVAIQLRLSPGLIGIIKSRNDGPQQAFDDVITRWLNGMKGTRQPITWRTLLTVFKDIDHCVLASDIENTLPEATDTK